MVADELVATTFGNGSGLEGAKQTVTKFRIAFPDQGFTIEGQITERDKVGMLSGHLPEQGNDTVRCFCIQRRHGSCAR